MSITSFFYTLTAITEDNFLSLTGNVLLTKVFSGGVIQNWIQRFPGSNVQRPSPKKRANRNETGERFYFLFIEIQG